MLQAVINTHVHNGGDGFTAAGDEYVFPWAMSSMIYRLVYQRTQGSSPVILQVWDRYPDAAGANKLHELTLSEQQEIMNGLRLECESANKPRLYLRLLGSSMETTHCQLVIIGEALR